MGKILILDCLQLFCTVTWPFQVQELIDLVLGGLEGVVGANLLVEFAQHDLPTGERLASVVVQTGQQPRVVTVLELIVCLLAGVQQQGRGTVDLDFNDVPSATVLVRAVDV